MPGHIWNHTDPINGEPAQDIINDMGITPSTIVALWGEAPPTDTCIIQPFNPDAADGVWPGATQTAKEQAALAWASAHDNRPPAPDLPPSPAPPAPTPPPSNEQLAAELAAANATIASLDASLNDLILWSFTVM